MITQKIVVNGAKTQRYARRIAVPHRTRSVFLASNALPHPENAAVANIYTFDHPGHQLTIPLAIKEMDRKFPLDRLPADLMKRVGEPAITKWIEEFEGVQRPTYNFFNINVANEFFKKGARTYDTENAVVWSLRGHFVKDFRHAGERAGTMAFLEATQDHFLAYEAWKTIVSDETPSPAQTLPQLEQLRERLWLRGVKLECDGKDLVGALLCREDIASPVLKKRRWVPNKIRSFFKKKMPLPEIPAARVVLDRSQISSLGKALVLLNDLLNVLPSDFFRRFPIKTFNFQLASSSILGATVSGERIDFRLENFAHSRKAMSRALLSTLSWMAFSMIKDHVEFKQAFDEVIQAKPGLAIKSPDIKSLTREIEDLRGQQETLNLEAQWDLADKISKIEAQINEAHEKEPEVLRKVQESMFNTFRAVFLDYLRGDLRMSSTPNPAGSWELARLRMARFLSAALFQDREFI